jgi:signal transduction histidine kinase
LFICRRIVERHDGTVTMEDRGGGSIFVVRLPWDDGRGDQRSAS